MFCNETASKNKTQRHRRAIKKKLLLKFQIITSQHQLFKKINVAYEYVHTYEQIVLQCPSEFNSDFYSCFL